MIGIIKFIKCENEILYEVYSKEKKTISDLKY